MPQGNQKSEYVAPQIKTVGNLHENTLRGKNFGQPNDGDFFSGKSLTTVS